MAKGHTSREPPADDSVAVAAYRADLIPIAGDSDLAGFDASAASNRVEFLTRFWTGRDRDELRGDGERIREHYRRLLYARRNFALTIWRRDSTVPWTRTARAARSSMTAA